jgi:hypothetical protein
LGKRRRRSLARRKLGLLESWEAKERMQERAVKRWRRNKRNKRRESNRAIQIDDFDVPLFRVGLQNSNGILSAFLFAKDD